MVNFSKDGSLFGTGGSDSNLTIWKSNLIDAEQEEEVEKVKASHKASRRAMEGEDDVKPKTKWASKRYKSTKKKEEEVKTLAATEANKEN